MPNWCSNWVTFKGQPVAIEQIRQLFKKMADREKKDECGQLPDFVESCNGGYFFDIYQEDDTADQIRYETRWTPNIEIVQAIADHYQVDFVQDYEELGCWVYGQATYSDKLLSDVYLEDEDFEAYWWDEETDAYHFEGKTFESDHEIRETLLERKIKIHQR